MGVYDLVAELVDRGLTVDLEILNELVFQHCFADDVPLLRFLSPAYLNARSCFRFANNGPRG
jgi:hypothetical protein